MQLSLDGYAADASGRTDWMVWNFGGDWKWDAALQKYHTELTDSIDTVLLSRKMAQEGFIDHWASVAKQRDNPQSVFAGNIARAHKVVFTKTLSSSVWENTELATGDLVREVQKQKELTGKDLIVYGGVGFVSALVRAGLIDEYHLVVNPVLLGNGLSIFKDTGRKALQLLSVRQYDHGMSVLIYEKK